MTSTYRPDLAPFLGPLADFRPVAGPIRSSMLLALLMAVFGRAGGARPGVEGWLGSGVPAPLGGPDTPDRGARTFGAPTPSAGVLVLLEGKDGGRMLVSDKIGFKIGRADPGGRGGPPAAIGGPGVPPILGGGGVAVFFAASGLSGLTHFPSSLS